MDKQAQWDIETLQKTIGVIPYEEMERDAIERAIKALEKQIPKKPIEATWDYEAGYECPTCKYVVEQNQKYCSVCGQKLATDINWKWDSVQFD